MSDPYVRDIITIIASPNLASHTDTDKIIILINIALLDDSSIFSGISIIRLSILDSRKSNDINKWFLLSISPTIDRVTAVLIIIT
jgi:hypothetical protein